MDDEKVPSVETIETWSRFMVGSAGEWAAKKYAFALCGPGPPGEPDKVPPRPAFFNLYERN